jgi:hypothetical protein
MIAVLSQGMMLEFHAAYSSGVRGWMLALGVVMVAVSTLSRAPSQR